MKLKEPVTAITDHLLGIELLFFSVLLFLKSGPHLSVQLWAAAFLVLGIAAFAGGIFHGNRVWFDASGLARLQASIVAAVAFSVALMLSAGIVSSFGGTVRLLLLGLEMVLLPWMAPALIRKYGGALLVDPSLKSIAASFAILSVFLTYQIVSNGPHAGNWILAGGLVVLIAAATQQTKIRMHRHLNHNDFCHLILMGAMYLLYRGGLLLRDH